MISHRVSASGSLSGPSRWETGTALCIARSLHSIRRRLVYSWRGGSARNPGYGSALDSTVEWTLTPEPGGTRVRMEHSGFGPQNAPAYDAMSGGWPRVLERLEQASATLGDN